METTKKEFLDKIQNSNNNNDKAAALEGVLVEAFADALNHVDYTYGMDESRTRALIALGTIGNALLNHYKK